MNLIWTKLGNPLSFTDLLKMYNTWCRIQYGFFHFLAAYISPDTLVLRENGNLSFKAIPEDKPLEVIFMAPELQQKGKLSDKVALTLEIAVKHHSDAISWIS